MTVVPLLSDQWLGTGPQPLELRRDRSWYARCADESHIGCIFAIRQWNHYLDRKPSPGWRSTAVQFLWANVVKALVYLAWLCFSPYFGTNLFLLKSASNISKILWHHSTNWNLIPVSLSFHRIFYSSKIFGLALIRLPKSYFRTVPISS